MSFSRAFQWYHSHLDPIWLDGTFKMAWVLRMSKNAMGEDGMGKNGMNNNGMGGDDVGISWTFKWRCTE